MQLLIEHGANIETQNIRGFTPIQYATFANNLVCERQCTMNVLSLTYAQAIMKVLLKAGARVGPTNYQYVKTQEAYELLRKYPT